MKERRSMDKLVKKTDNKGFTLVELIVVIAILGVLMAVLVPQYIQYVEKSRVATDEAAIAEVAHAAEIASAEENVYDEIKNGNTTITVADNNAPTSTSTNLESAIKAVISTVDLKSNKYEGETITITIDSNGKAKWTKANS